MDKFKVDDRVKVTNPSSYHDHVGDIVVIEGESQTRRYTQIKFNKEA